MADDVLAWFNGRLPAEWASGDLQVTVDREEISVVVPIAGPDADTAADAEPHVRAAAEAGRVARWREETREQRIQIAREAEHRFERKVAWGVACGETKAMFTSLSVPVMTRLRQADRAVLDTLVDSGVARSRSHALAWCVRLVGQHSADWLVELREALSEVERLRESGPASATGAAS
jgi:hypothetical protein